MSSILRVSVLLAIAGLVLYGYHITIGEYPENRVFVYEHWREFPWYKRHHPPLPMPRIVRETATIELAAAYAREQLGTEYENRIPGSRLRTPEQVSAVRSQLECWTKGSWTKVSHPDDLVKHFQDPIYGKCDKKSPDRDAVKYEWRPACPFIQHKIDSNQWCSVLDGRHILLVGDLVHYQLHEMLLDILRDGPVVCYGELSCRDHTLCPNHDKPINMRYIRNDKLSTGNKFDRANGHPRGDVLEVPFTQHFIIEEYSIFIINRAPVLEDDTVFIEELTETLQTIRRLQPDALIIYRSTSIGHPYCDDATGPLRKPLSEEEMSKLPYGWSEAGRRNALARVIVETAGGLFLDTAAVTDMRPDGHIGGQDCLRYCIPGPLDAWALLLYNTLLALDDTA